MSTVFGALSCISLVAVIYLTYLNGGAAPVNYGFAGLLILIFALVGIVLGVLAVQEKDMFKLFAWIGLALNFLAPAGIRGLRLGGF